MLYVSPVEGHLAPRYGSARVTPPTIAQHPLVRGRAGLGGKTSFIPVRQAGTVQGHEYFGVTRKQVANEEGVLEWQITWNTELVVAITDRELAQHRREYMQLLRDGALRERTKADHDAYLAAELERSKDHAQKAAAKAPAAPPPPAPAAPATEASLEA